MDNSELFEEMLQIDDEWGEVPQASLLEDIAEELEEEAEIPQYELLTEAEGKRQNHLALGLGISGITLPFIFTIFSLSLFLPNTSLIGASSFILCGLSLIVSGILLVKSKIYWHHDMVMPYEVQKNRIHGKGIALIGIGVIEIAIGISIHIVGLGG